MSVGDEDTLPLIQLRVRISLPLEEVWEKFLDPILMIQWLGEEITADFSEERGITFLGKHAPTTGEIGNTWVIEKIREDHAILFAWTILGVETLFLLQFKRIGPGTQMEIKHGPVPSAARDLHLPEHWTLILANFKSVVELGTPALRFDYTKYNPFRITRYDPTDVRLSVLIRAPPSLPFDVWTNPEKLRHFIRAKNPIVDERYGGLYTWWDEGMGPVVFTRMEPEQEIEFSWVYRDEPETRVNIRFEEVDNDTLVTLHHYGFKQPEDVVGYQIGWASILAELKLVCELGESGIERIAEWEV